MSVLWRARNEDSIGEDLYGGGPEVSHHEVTGYYRGIVAGHVASGDFRELGTSGGMTSWLLHELLGAGQVDGVIHVTSTLGGLPGPLSEYGISRTIEELLAGRKSRYHVQTLAGVLAQVKEEPGRYAVVGVPCFIKAVRLVADADEVIGGRIVFTASFVCGHFKSTLYSDYLAWSVGIQPSRVLEIDYRHKEPGRPPNRYSVRVTPREGEDVVLGVEQIPLADWGLGSSSWGPATAVTTSSARRLTSASVMRGCRRSCRIGEVRTWRSHAPDWPRRSSMPAKRAERSQ